MYFFFSSGLPLLILSKGQELGKDDQFMERGSMTVHSNDFPSMLIIILLRAIKEDLHPKSLVSCQFAYSRGLNGTRTPFSTAMI